MAALSETATDIAHYAVTEIVNNAVDHSGGSRVTMTVSEARGEAVVTVDDDGVGIFDHVRERLGLPSRLDALLELHKGKTTTMPDRHSGEGLFFVSKAVRWLEITSGGLRWIVDNGRDDMAIHEAPPRVGTRVAFAVPHAPRRPPARRVRRVHRRLRVLANARDGEALRLRREVRVPLGSQGA